VVPDVEELSSEAPVEEPDAEPAADDSPEGYQPPEQWDSDEPLGDAPDFSDSYEELSLADHEPTDQNEDDSADDEPEPEPDADRLITRPLGQAPLLDSKPLPATRPGMLRPRSPEQPSDGFSLPVQRPAFDLGPGEPADIN
jgi:hypothetical protein